MLYLLDANVLISAHELHYSLKRIPQFWAWLVEMADAGTIKLPDEIYNEISVSKGELSDWIGLPAHCKQLKLDARVNAANLQAVISEGYAPDLNESEFGTDRPRPVSDRLCHRLWASGNRRDKRSF